jgi:hypothetical protein
MHDFADVLYRETLRFGDLADRDRALLVVVPGQLHQTS